MKTILHLMLALLGWAMAAAAGAQPVQVDSPAWKALMARPAADGEVTAFYAADLLDAWQRPTEGDQLRRALLGRHLRAGAGEAVAPGVLAAVWQAGSPSPDELVAWHARAAARAPQAAWARTVPRSPEAVRLLAEQLGNRPPADLPEFVRTWGRCLRVDSCRTVGPQGDAEREARILERARQAQARQAESERRSRERQRRAERMQAAVLLGYVFGGLLLHLLLARHAGTLVAGAATVLLGPALTALAWSQWGVGSGWGGLAMLIFYMGLAGSGLLLLPLYRWVHRTWFAGR